MNETELKARLEFVDEYNFLDWFYEQVRGVEPGLTKDLRNHFELVTGDVVPEKFREEDYGEIDKDV
jgi:hypothetical protein